MKGFFDMNDTYSCEGQPVCLPDGSYYIIEVRIGDKTKKVSEYMSYGPDELHEIETRIKNAWKHEFGC